MKKQDAISHFGSARELARAVGISDSAVCQWGDYVPPSTAFFLEKLTKGILAFDPLLYRNRRGRLWTPAPDHQKAA